MRTLVLIVPIIDTRKNSGFKEVLKMIKSLNMGAKVVTTNPLVTLPDEIFSNILKYLGWGDVGRLDTAFLNHETRNSYLFALQLMKVKVEDKRFWE